MTTDPLRRRDVLRMTPIEKMISDTVRAIETTMKADPRLTRAQMLLVEAASEVGDYVDQHNDALGSISDALNDVFGTSYTVEELAWRSKHPACAALGHTPDPGGFCPECRPDSLGGPMVSP